MICLTVIQNALCAVIVISTPKIPLKQHLQTCAATINVELELKVFKFLKTHVEAHRRGAPWAQKKVLRLKIENK